MSSIFHRPSLTALLQGPETERSWMSWVFLAPSAPLVSYQKQLLSSHFCHQNQSTHATLWYRSCQNSSGGCSWSAPKGSINFIWKLESCIERGPDRQKTKKRERESPTQPSPFTTACTSGHLASAANRSTFTDGGGGSGGRGSGVAVRCRPPPLLRWHSRAGWG